MDWYQILWFFVIYSFLGWVIEVAFHGVTLGRIVNRGFLNGPVCPVYGFGVVGILLLTSRLETSSPVPLSTPMLFVMGVVVATLIELFTGWLLDVLFHARWWDYSDRLLNFRGYICPLFSLIWGAAIVFVIKVMQPVVNRPGEFWIPERYGWWILAVLYVGYAADLVVTVAVVRDMNKRLKELDQIRNSMRIVSDSLSEIVGGTTIMASQKIGEGQVQAALAKAELKDAAAQKKEALTGAAYELKDAAALATAGLKDAAVQKKEALTGAAYELKDAAALATAGLKDAAVQKKDELTGAAYELKDAAALATAGLKDAVAQKRDETVESMQRRKEALQRRADELAESMTRARFGTRRIMRAFPAMVPRDYKETWNELKERIKRSEK